jgi:hypothetical protein
MIIAPLLPLIMPALWPAPVFFAPPLFWPSAMLFAPLRPMARLRRYRRAYQQTQRHRTHHHLSHKYPFILPQNRPATPPNGGMTGQV